MTCQDGLEGLIRLRWAQCWALATSDVSVAVARSERPGIVVRSPGLEAFFESLDGLFDELAYHCVRQLASARREPAREAELRLCAYECLSMRRPGNRIVDAPACADEVALCRMKSIRS
jgi:hypothetical protein